MKWPWHRDDQPRAPAQVGVNQVANAFFRTMTPERVGIVADLLCKLIGETIQSKIIRAILMGAIAAGTQLIQAYPNAVTSPPPGVFAPAPPIYRAPMPVQQQPPGHGPGLVAPSPPGSGSGVAPSPQTVVR